MLVLVACGTATAPPDVGSISIAAPSPTITPPFRALPGTPVSTPSPIVPPASTDNIALAATPTALSLPSATATPTSRPRLDYTPLPTFGAPLQPPVTFSASQPISNGSQIFYVQDGNLWAIDDAGNNPRRITDGNDINTNGTVASDLVWTAAGDRAAYINKKNELVILSLGKGGSPPLFFKPTIANMVPTQPTWSPDGRILAFALRPLDLAPVYAGEVWTAEFSGTKPILQKIDDGFAPAWSPDNRYLAYLTRAGQKDIGAVDQPTPTRFAGPTAAGTPLLPPTYTATAVAASAPRLDNNALVVYTLGLKRGRRLFQTSELTGYPGIDGQKNYETKSSALAALWWSPDSRYIAFADQHSYIGVVGAGGGSPVMWAGLPEAFAVRKVMWQPSTTGVLFSWNNPGSDDRTFLAQISGLGTQPNSSTNSQLPNPMSSQGRITILPSEWVFCPALSPAGDLVAYADPKLRATLVVRLDWSVYSLLPEGDCPVWSSDGRSFATTLRNADNMLATISPDLSNLRPMSQARGASGLYWQRPELFPTDLNLLTPAPANTPQPGVTAIKPDRISPPPDGSPAPPLTPPAAPSPSPSVKPARSPTPKK